MRYFSIYKPDPKNVATPPTPEFIAEMGKLIQEYTQSGALLATEGFHPSADDVRVRLSGGEFSVTDGPFTEAKELIGGFALMQAKSKQEMIQLTKRFLQVAGGGECEIHELMEAPELPLEKAPKR